MGRIFGKDDNDDTTREQAQQQPEQPRAQETQPRAAQETQPRAQETELREEVTREGGSADPQATPEETSPICWTTAR